MKLITFAIPSYNAASYLNHCVDTLLTAGEEAEIIIVNDGSTDATAAIADGYAARYPSIVRVVHKANGGHGSGVNKGLELATGLYYKVVDADDWLDAAALATLLQTVRAHRAAGTAVDLYITNYVYERMWDNTQYVQHYRKNMPKNVVFSWNAVKRFHTSRVLLMHSVVYRTEALRASGTVLPEHTFYVDNLFAYKPLPFMKSLYYLDIDMYRYFIGRPDQSVTLVNIVKRYRQQQLVMRRMLEAYTYADIKKMNKGLRGYMLHDLNVIMVNTLMFTLGEQTDERVESMRGLWQELKSRDPALFAALKRRGYAVYVYMVPRPMRARVLLMGYKHFRRKLKLG
ncbi:MAG: glycosyltransferase family 2 protein [Clostridiales bacterium]|nr:glycosyltransferase family 2 protein [Clostridiales bacterium]